MIEKSGNNLEVQKVTILFNAQELMQKFISKR